MVGEFVKGTLSGNLQLNPKFNGSILESDTSLSKNDSLSMKLSADVFDASKVDFQALTKQHKSKKSKKDPS